MQELIESFNVKDATGRSTRIYKGFVMEAAQVLSSTIFSVTSYEPVAAYACVGDVTAEVPPSPKSHVLVKGEERVVFVKVTVAPGQVTVSREMKFGLGSVVPIILALVKLSLQPAASVTINCTEKVSAIVYVCINGGPLKL